MGRESESCFDPATGEPLREFDRRRDAVRSAKLDPLDYRTREAYRCPKCDRWHLRPVADDAPVPTDTMCLMCRGRDGQPKIAHPSFEAALETAQSSTGPDLSVYACPHGRGWHLTKT